MPRTQKDNLLSLKQLRAAFADAPIDAITPQIIAQYRDKRTGKVRANREIALLSHIYNMAREWGITEKENPATGAQRAQPIKLMRSKLKYLNWLRKRSQQCGNDQV